jgi:hypothetical protein
MASKSESRRRSWYSQGVAAFRRARPGAPAVYPCPLCIRGFTTPSALTLEDVPPKSVGGKPIVLTCRTCNNTSGHLLDSHVRSGRDLKEVAEGKRDAPIRLTLFGQTINALARFSRGSISIAGTPKRNDPKTHKALFDELNRVATSATSWDITITVPSRYSPQRESIGWLRVAYLYVFAALGYQWVMRPELDPMREQFRKPDVRLVPGVIRRTDAASPGDGISFVYSPRALRSILVRLGANLYFFPNFNEASDFYERLAAQQQVSARIQIEGLHMNLPTKPLFAFDEDPKLMVLTVPPEERKSPSGGHDVSPIH